MDASYRLVCVQCGFSTREDRHRVHCPQCGPGSFLRTHYESDLRLRGPVDEFASYRSWLSFPLSFPLEGMRIGCLRAHELGEKMGLSNLWVLLSCWAPERGATLPTGTFKTLEAAGVMMRVLEQTDRTLIVSSAGNAGNAVLEFGTRFGVPAVVIIPQSACADMRVSEDPGPHSPLLICLEESTYPDAICMVGRIVDRFPEKLVREGGAYNVARRDAMGVPVLRAVQATGRIPDHYVQAVGSGTGGIAAWEAVMRLRGNGGFRRAPMKLHLVQNTPFTPMVDAWKSGNCTVRVMGPREAYEKLEQTYSRVLANADPPWSVAGGVREAVRSTDGDMVAVTNREAREHTDLIAGTLGIEPCPETGVAAAGLARQRAKGLIGRDDLVLLHATGGGLTRSIVDLDKRPYPASLTVGRDDVEAACRAVESYLTAERGPRLSA